MVFRVLSLTRAQPGSPVLKQREDWTEWVSVGAGQAPAAPPYLAAGGVGSRRAS